VIFQAVLTLGDNPTPEEVFKYVRRAIPSISFTTVYKNLDIFVNHQMLRDLSPNYGRRRIESTSTPHDHFVCRICRRVFDLPSTRSWVRPFDPTCHKAPLSNITLLNSSAFVGAAFNVVNQNGKVEDHF
jgi:Fe2+ or Zn2+ uptake regulation protein